MPTDAHPDLTATLRSILSTVLTEGEFDLIADETADTVEIQTDAWTLHLEGWPNGIAWLAIDHEPDTDDQFSLSIVETVGEKAIDAFRSRDGDFAGTLRSALHKSSDPLSIAFATLLAAAESSEDTSA